MRMALPSLRMLVGEKASSTRRCARRTSTRLLRGPDAARSAACATPAGSRAGPPGSPCSWSRLAHCPNPAFPEIRLARGRAPVVSTESVTRIRPFVNFTIGSVRIHRSGAGIGVRRGDLRAQGVGPGRYESPDWVTGVHPQDGSGRRSASQAVQEPEEGTWGDSSFNGWRATPDSQPMRGRTLHRRRLSRTPAGSCNSEIAVEDRVAAIS